MKWLITGGCGFIGRALVADLLERDDKNVIRVLDNLSVGEAEILQNLSTLYRVPLGYSYENWDDKVTLIAGDVLDREVVRSAVSGADIVVHLAANTGVAPSVENPYMDCETNVIGTLNMLEASRTARVKRFIFASSGAPLGVQIPPLHENLAPRPASPYGASKMAGEGYCSAYFHCFGVETVALRFGNVYGEGSAHKQSVVAKFISRAIAGETIELYGDGVQTRDFIHIADLIDALNRAAVIPGIGGEIFQIATSKETNLNELTKILCRVLDSEGITPPNVTYCEKRSGDVMRNFSSTLKAKEKLGWEASVDLEEGLRRVVRYFKEKNCENG